MKEPTGGCLVNLYVDPSGCLVPFSSRPPDLHHYLGLYSQ